MAATMRTYYNKDKKIWYGNKTEPNFSDKDSIGSVIFEALKKDPDHIRQVCKLNYKHICF